MNFRKNQRKSWKSQQDCSYQGTALNVLIKLPLRSKDYFIRQPKIHTISKNALSKFILENVNTPPPPTTRYTFFNKVI